MQSTPIEIEQPIKVSVILCTFNRQAIVRNTVGKLASQTYRNCEFLIIDQTATRDLTLENTINELGATFRYIRLPKPNLPAARNEGIRNSSGDIILFIDDDVDPDNDLVFLHVRTHRDSSNVGVVTGLCLDVDRPFEDSLEWCRKAFNVPSVTDGRVFDVTWAMGGNMSYARSALIHAGLFDENFRGCAIGEDNDASERVALKGYRILLDCRIQLKHLHLATGGCDVRNANEQDRVQSEHFELNMYRFLKRFLMNPSFASTLTLFRLFRQFTISRTLLRKGPRAILRREIETARILTRVFLMIYSWHTTSHNS
jgi:GT2 family glycosyltransferase